MTDQQAAEKAWFMRNSDYRDTWEGERSSPVHSTDIITAEMPDTQPTLENPADDADPRAERHVHVWTVDEPPAVEPELVLTRTLAPSPLAGDGHVPPDGNDAATAEPIVTARTPAPAD